MIAVLINPQLSIFQIDEIFKHYFYEQEKNKRS